MEHLFSSSKKFQSIVFTSALILGLTGVAHAEQQNPTGESTQKSVINKEKSGKENSTTDETKVTGKKQSKPGSDKDAANYKGAQPPQGGRLGQGPE